MLRDVRGVALAWALLVSSSAGCDTGPTDAERVRGAVEAIRLLEPANVEGRKAATEKLADLEVGPAAQPARDACAATYRASSELFGIVAELEGIANGPDPQAQELRARELFRRSSTLQTTAQEELTRCNVELSKL